MAYLAFRQRDHDEVNAVVIGLEVLYFERDLIEEEISEIESDRPY